jgi:hypothetical protein
MDSAKLNAIRESVVGYGVVSRYGKVFKTWLDPHRNFTSWASSARAGVSMSTWMRDLTLGRIGKGLASLEESVRNLNGPAAAALPAELLLCQMLGYCNEHGRWHYSQFWRVADDVFRENQPDGREIHQVFNDEMRGVFQGWTAVENDEDGTPRFNGTPWNAMRWGAWLLDELRGVNHFISSDLMRRVIGGGPFGNGTGTNQPNEGMQVHLVMNEMMWEDPHELRVPGVPNHTAMARDGGDGGTSNGTIIAIPEYGIAMAHRGPVDASHILPQLCAAVN